jgi:PAS domain S-box-containing protein
LITVWNRQAEKLFGWQEAEAMGKPMADIIIPIERRDKHKADFSNYLKNGEGLVLNKAIELTALTKTGEEFPIEIAVVHVKQDSADFFCAFVRDIRERKRFEENLKKMEMRIVEQKIQEQKKLARAMIKAQEEEKNRIGQELHDNINQILAGTKIFLSIAAKKDKVVSDLVKYPMELIDNSIEEIRSLSRKQVTPLKNIDLEELVQELISSLDENSMPEVKFNYEVPADLLPDDLKLSIYRILQEQMNNILKHAAAKHVLISIRAGSEAIELVVEDDGIGFNVNIRRKGIGISNMINRVDTFNGTVDINSEPGKGCKITVKIPF